MTMKRIGAIVLAAGISSRMGRPKMVLPWGNNTVIGRVISVLEASGVGQICVVTGGAEPLVRKALEHTTAKIVTNPNYSYGAMLES